MTIHFDIPGEIERIFASQGQDPNQAAKEAALVELFRQGRLDHSQFASALGISRNAADGVLKTHGVALDTSVEEVSEDLAALRRLRRP